jgi:hypothetical protein
MVDQLDMRLPIGLLRFHGGNFFLVRLEMVHRGDAMEHVEP